MFGNFKKIFGNGTEESEMYVKYISASGKLSDVLKFAHNRFPKDVVGYIFYRKKSEEFIEITRHYIGKAISFADAGISAFQEDELIKAGFIKVMRTSKGKLIFIRASDLVFEPSTFDF